MDSQKLQKLCQWDKILNDSWLYSPISPILAYSIFFLYLICTCMSLLKVMTFYICDYSAKKIFISSKWSICRIKTSDFLRFVPDHILRIWKKEFENIFILTHREKCIRISMCTMHVNLNIVIYISYQRQANYGYY